MSMGNEELGERPSAVTGARMKDSYDYRQSLASAMDQDMASLSKSQLWAILQRVRLRLIYVIHTSDLNVFYFWFTSAVVIRSEFIANLVIAVMLYLYYIYDFTELQSRGDLRIARSALEEKQEESEQLFVESRCRVGEAHQQPEGSKIAVVPRRADPANWAARRRRTGERLLTLAQTIELIISQFLYYNYIVCNNNNFTTMLYEELTITKKHLSIIF